MKPVYAFGSLFVFTVGIGAALGIDSYLSTGSESASAQQLAIVQTTQPVQPKLVANIQSVQDFDNLSSLCDQIDAIAKSGRSAAEFIAESGRYSQFEANVKANCDWNTEQLNQAYAILNPPVITIQPRVIQENFLVKPHFPVSQPPIVILPSLITPP